GFVFASCDPVLHSCRQPHELWRDHLPHHRVRERSRRPLSRGACPNDSSRHDDVFGDFRLRGRSCAGARKGPHPRDDRAGLWGREIPGRALPAVWAILMPLIILVGVAGGIFTVTESAGVAVIYAAFVGMVVYRELHPRDLFRILVQTALDSALVMFIIAMA